MSDAAENTTAFQETPEYRNELLSGPRSKALLVGIAGLVAYGVIGAGLVSAGMADVKQFMIAYLVGFLFWLSMSLGSWFFQCIHYVTGGRWGILMRRPMEANMRTWVFGFVLFLPVAGMMFAGKSSIYWWSGHKSGEHTSAEENKADAGKEHGKDDHAASKGDHKDSPWKRANVARPNLEIDEDLKVEHYLNPIFSAIRGVLYFVIAGLAMFWILSNSNKAENSDENTGRIVRNKQKYAATIGLCVFPLIMTFVSTDWIMSIEKTFASSMFPVIVFDNAAIISYAFGMLTLLYLKSKKHPHFENLFPPTEQIHLGSMLLAFTLAWTYFNFSQFMLIWIGNLPEEIPYYLRRTKNGWQYYAIIMTVFHFFVPFLLLLFRDVKSNPKVLRNICLGLLAVCFADVFWWINPSFIHENATAYWLMDIAAWFGVGGLWIWYYLGQLAKRPLLPTRELYILEAYNHGH